MNLRSWAEVIVASVGLVVAAVVLDLTGSGIRVAGAEFLQAYDLSIDKTPSNTTVIAGTQLKYTITVMLTGGPTDHITLTDALPPDTTFESLTQPTPTEDDFACTTPPVGGTGSITCTKDNMTADSSQKLYVTVNIPPDTPKDTVISNTATVKPSICIDGCDDYEANDTVTANNTVDTHADLVLMKSAEPDAVVAGLPIAYTLTVENNGPSTAQDVMIADSLPQNVGFVSANPSSGGSCVTPPPDGTGMVECTYPGPTAPGESRSVVIVVHTCVGEVSTCPPEVVNSGEGSSSTFDPNTGDNTATATTDVASAAPVLSGVGLVIEILLLLVLGAWALARLRVVRHPGGD
jgi:uncharacterized repeat protein (TIGR01451 family)